MKHQWALRPRALREPADGEPDLGQLPIALRAMSHIPTPDDERSEALGGSAARGIVESRFEPPARPHGVD
jgi:hypothetical protein